MKGKKNQGPETTAERSVHLLSNRLLIYHVIVLVPVLAPTVSGAAFVGCRPRILYTS